MTNIINSVNFVEKDVYCSVEIVIYPGIILATEF